ncbi:MAG TPA: glycosyltransferase family 39 protein [Candidatus Limnocylindrales bacterium]|nr:glycosyltransferase family 39 protein [Candidatus Limnocylindrales bacterium]
MRPSGVLLLAVFALWLAAVFAVGTGGEFPLSDDWAYAHVVRSICEGRGFDFLPWTGASLVFQAAYGALFAKLSGFSYELLRLTTLAVSAIGIFSTYALLREAGPAADSGTDEHGMRIAAAGAATVAFSPLWFNLSFTFMTDVPFAALATMSAWLYARAFRSGSRPGLLAAGAVCAAAFLVRQHGVWIAAAAALAAVATAPRTARLRDRAQDAAAAAIVPFVAAAAYVIWAVTSPVVPLAVHNKIGEAAGVSWLTVANASFRGLATLGFFLLPWAPVIGLAGVRQRRLFSLSFAALGAAAAYLYAREGATMFYLSNMLGDFWIGPWTTRDIQFLGHRPDGDAGVLFHVALTAASLASAALLVSRLAAAPFGRADAKHDASDRAVDAGGRRRVAVFCVAAFALSALGTLTQSHYFFDRYLIVLVPLAMAAVVALAGPLRAGGAFAALLAAVALYSVAGTHDYMERNRARWDLLGALEARGVTARSIDGGVEYNGERLADELRTSPTDVEARRGQPQSRKSWWWVIDDRWILAYGPLDGYREADSRRFTRWLPPGEDRVLVLERNDSVDAASGAEPAREH